MNKYIAISVFSLCVLLAGLTLNSEIQAQTGNPKQDKTILESRQNNAWADLGWGTSVSIFNPAETTGVITVTVSDTSGKSVYSTFIPLNPKESTTLDMATMPLPDQFFGSATLTSDTPVVVQTELISDNNTDRALYGHVPHSSKLFSDLLYCDFYSFNSELALMNTAAQEANVTIEFLQQGEQKTVRYTLPAHGSQYINICEATGADTRWRGFATITSDGANLAQVNLITSLSEKPIRIYTSSAMPQEGAETVYFPISLKTETNFTSHSILNVGTTSTQVTVLFYDQQGNLVTSYPTSLEPFTVEDIITPNKSQIPSDFEGSAVATTQNGLIVGHFEQASTIEASCPSTVKSASSALAPTLADAASSLNVPQVEYTSDGWQSRIIIQNVGEATTTQGNITVKYYNNLGSLVGTDNLGNIARLASKISSPSNIKINNFAGAAIIESSNANDRLVAVNQKTSASGCLKAAAKVSQPQKTIELPLFVKSPKVAPTPTATPSPTPTSTPTLTPTATPSPTLTLTPIPTATDIPSGTPILTVTSMERSFYDYRLKQPDLSTLPLSIGTTAYSGNTGNYIIEARYKGSQPPPRPEPRPLVILEVDGTVVNASPSVFLNDGSYHQMGLFTRYKTVYLPMVIK